MHTLSDYSFDLPEHLIAQTAVHPHDHAKLLVCTPDRDGQYQYEHRHYYDIPNIPNILSNNSSSVLRPSSLLLRHSSSYHLFFNNSKVIKVRIPLINVSITLPNTTNTQLEKGEIFIYTLDETDPALAQGLVSDGKHFRPGSIIHISEHITIYSEHFTTDGIQFRIQGAEWLAFLDVYAQLPLPPYIAYDKSKEIDYQTSFASIPGSVAAPTASLHFTSTLINQIQHSGIQTHYLTLHVGLGTFKPIDRQDFTHYTLHDERAIIPHSLFATIASAKQLQQPIIPVGTTMIRTLESLPYVRSQLSGVDRSRHTLETQQRWDTITTTKEIGNDTQPTHIIYTDEHHICFTTHLFIRPGFHRQIIDGFFTNFHLPASSLCILVATLMGYDARKKTYQTAITSDYRFYSFGDGMFVQL